MIKEYLKRFFICALGLACFAIGNVFGIHAGSAGTNAWNTLALGISGQTSLSFGTVTLLISGLVVLIDIIFKGRIGFGTLMNAILISWFSDLFLSVFRFLPTAQNQLIGAALTIIGQTIISFSTILYMSAGLGCGRAARHSDGNHRESLSQGANRFHQVLHGAHRNADRGASRRSVRTWHRSYHGASSLHLSNCLPRLPL